MKIIIILYHRCCLVLLRISIRNFLVVSHSHSLLGIKVSIACKVISAGRPYEVHPHTMCCGWAPCATNTCGCHYLPVLIWKVIVRSSERWTWIWDYSFSTNLVCWKGEVHNILLAHTSSLHNADGWNNVCRLHLLDHTQSKQPLS